MLGPEGELQWQIQCASSLHMRESLLLARQLEIKQLRFSSKNIFNWRKFKLKIRKLSGFQGFQSPEVRGKKGYNNQTSIIGFQFVAKI